MRPSPVTNTRSHDQPSMPPVTWHLVDHQEREAKPACHARATPVGKRPLARVESVRIRPGLQDGSGRIVGETLVEVFDRLHNEVAQVGVETDGPAVEEAFVPEEAKGQSLVKDEVDVGRPRIVEGSQPQGDWDGDGLPRVAEEFNPNLTYVGYLQPQGIRHATREDRPRCSGVDERLGRDLQVTGRQLNIDGRTEYLLTSGERLLFPPSKDLELAGQDQPAPTMKASEDGRTYSMTTSALLR